MTCSNVLQKLFLISRLLPTNNTKGQSSSLVILRSFPVPIWYILAASLRVRQTLSLYGDDNSSFSDV